MRRNLVGLDNTIDRCVALASFASSVAIRIAARVEDMIRANIAAGRAPDGTPWPKTADGHAPLTHAAKSLRVYASGPRIVVELDGVAAMHDTGHVRGGVRRQIVPDGLTPAMAAMIEQVAQEEWSRVMGGPS